MNSSEALNQPPAFLGLNDTRSLTDDSMQQNSQLKSDLEIKNHQPIQLNASKHFQNQYKSEMKEVIPIFDFLSQIKAIYHNDINNLFLLSTYYSHVRPFIGSQQPVFLAISFAFFEKFFLQDSLLDKHKETSPILNEILNRNTETLLGCHNPAYQKLVSGIKTFIEEGDLFDGRHLYESMCSNADTYEASLMLFAELLEESFKNKSNTIKIPELNNSAPFSYKWMNNIPISENSFYQAIANIMKTSFKVISLDSERMEQKTFFSDSLMSPRLSPTLKELAEVIIFVDKRHDTCYLLYTSKEKRKSYAGIGKSPVKVSQKFDFMNTLQRKSSRKLIAPVPILKSPTKIEEDKRGRSLSYFEPSQYTQYIPAVSQESVSPSVIKHFNNHINQNIYSEPSTNNTLIDHKPAGHNNESNENIFLHKEENKVSIETSEKPIPFTLKEKFLTYNKEVQKHEMEFSNITNRYLCEQKQKEEANGRILALASKYKSIVEKRQQMYGESQLSGGMCMAMDSNFFLILILGINLEIYAFYEQHSYHISSFYSF